ncbi:MAG: restriction endonuclease subunit S [Halioglobus sp.]|nr:restriction endonuclease subunit S [Halioglobus sp.]
MYVFYLRLDFDIAEATEAGHWRDGNTCKADHLFKSTWIPLPPLTEQKRIVAILDEAFAGIDAAIANTEKNLANARELFESYLNSVFSQRGGWVETLSKIVSDY